MIPKCKCGNECHINKAYPNKGYTLFCSDACAKKYRNTNKEWYQYLSNYDWLYNQRVNLKKSKQTIANEIGCSHTVVSKWLKTHKIESDHRYSNTSLLNNKQWLEEQYKTNHKSCEDIANQLGISKSTVSVYLAKNDIEANSSNSYDNHNYVSNEEQQVVDFIKSIYNGEVITSNRSILNGQEIDIYIPEFNLAFEYDGLYSHAYRPWESTPSLIKDRNYHLNKTLKCKEKGIALYHIFSDEWANRPSAWQNMIQSRLQKNTITIPARKCPVEPLNGLLCDYFLDQYHIQGKDKSGLKTALFYKNEPIAVMTFGKSRFNKNVEWELIRYCVKSNYNIPGGFSKLLTHFRREHPGTIVSYADRRYSDGGVYEKNGFKLIRTNRPNYKYIDKGRRNTINRMLLQKKNLLKVLNKPELTEEQLAYELGYMKIYDCGTLTFVI